MRGQRRGSLSAAQPVANLSANLTDMSTVNSDFGVISHSGAGWIQFVSLVELGNPRRVPCDGGSKLVRVRATRRPLLTARRAMVIRRLALINPSTLAQIIPARDSARKDGCKPANLVREVGNPVGGS